MTASEQGRQLLARAPLPALLAVPGLLAALTAAVLPRWTVAALVAATAVTTVLGVLLAGELRHFGRGRVQLSRELVGAAARYAAVSRRAGVLENLVEANRADAQVASQTSATLFSELVRAEEGVRAQLAAELHDTVAQSLARALGELRRDDRLRDSAGLDCLIDAEEQLRGVMARVRPPELADGDLARAVNDLCLDLEHRYGVAVDVTWPTESVPLPGPLATTLYRFLQESLLNTVTHADGVGVALRVAVLHRDGHRQLEACVSDRGPGFVPSEVKSSKGRHVGLRLARERARLAGGTLEIDSVPGRGTTVTLRLPLGPDLTAVAAPEADTSLTLHLPGQRVHA